MSDLDRDKKNLEDGVAQDASAGSGEAAQPSDRRESGADADGNYPAGADDVDGKSAQNSEANTCSGVSEGPHKAGYANADGHYHKPNKLTYKNVSFRADDRETADFNSARSLSTLATVIGVFSVFFGGVVLSAIGLVAGAFAWKKMNRISKQHPEDPRVHKALRHAGITPVVVCIVALALNVLMLALMYPMYQQLIDSGQISNVLQMPNSGFNPGGTPYDFGQGAANGSSTWG